MNYQPGVIPFRPLGLGDIYGATFKIIRGNPASTVGVALIVALAALIPSTPLGLWVARQGSGTFDPFADPNAVTPDAFFADFLLVQLGQYIPTIAGSMATIVLAGFIAYTTGQAVLGRKIKLPEAWAGTRPYLLRIIGVSILVWVALAAVMIALLAPGTAMLIMGAMQDNDSLLGGGLIALFVLGLLAVVVVAFLWTRLALVGSAIVLEGASVWGSMRRSWQLTTFKGGFWRVFGIRLLTSLGATLVASIVVTPIALIMFGTMFLGGMSPDAMVSTQVIGTAVTTLITATLSTPVIATVDTLLYLDQRIRNEGLDVHLIQAVDGQAPLPWLPASVPAGHSGAATGSTAQ